jgi:hypothetical protein
MSNEIGELTDSVLKDVSGGSVQEHINAAWIKAFCSGTQSTTTNIASPDGTVHTTTSSTGVPNCTPA